MHELMNTTKEVFGKIEKNGEQGQAAKNQAQENLKYDFWLASLLYIDSRKRIRVREMCGSAQAVYELREETLKNMYLFTDTELQYLLESRKKDLNRIWECFLAKNMRLLPYSSRAYPDKLTHIAQPPYAIFCKGAMPDARKSVGIVGARMCSEYGRSIATKLGKLLADKDVQVISGMALGIDSASHAGALQGKGSTFAVLGCGCDVCYPKNARNLYENIQSSGGGILSEYPPGRFGDALSEGCNALIGQGAGIIYDLDIFLENLGYLPEKEAETTKIKNISLAKTEQLVYCCLDLHPKHINYIIEETGLDLLTVLRDLGNLKRYRLVQETFQNYFSKSI